MLSASTDPAGVPASILIDKPPSVVPLRAELQIMSEMRKHMDMHRKLLMHKEGMLSNYAASSSVPNDGPVLHPPTSRVSSHHDAPDKRGDGKASLLANEWWNEEDPFDDSLFSFLVEPIEQTSDGYIEGGN